MDIGQALLRIPTVETGGKMLFGRALSRLRRPTVMTGGEDIGQALLLSAGTRRE